MKIIDWGLIDYKEALAHQMELVESIASGGEDTLIFCSHPAVVTLGRGSKPEDITAWQGEIIETTRGGRATYHGPNQLVVYPIINLAKTARKKLKEKDIHAYLKLLEDILVTSLKDLGIEATGGLHKNKKQSDLSHTGVWVGDHKLASIGIGVKKWISYHGAAINLSEDKLAFTGISPCGFSQDTMTHLTRLGVDLDLSTLKTSIAANFTQYLS